MLISGNLGAIIDILERVETALRKMKPYTKETQHFGISNFPKTRAQIFEGDRLSKNKNSIPIQARTFDKPIQWCEYIIKAGYATVAVIALAHIVWYFAAREILAHSPEVYLRDYIVLPTIGLLALTLIADFFVRSHRMPLLLKEYTVLILFILFSFYLCLTHKIATVLFGSFVLPVFTSTIFSNIKMTRRIFGISNLALLISGTKMYFTYKFDNGIPMEVFVAWDMLLCSYLLAKALIRYGQDNLLTLMHSYQHQKSIQEQLKLDLYTGLYNKKTFDDCLPGFIEECRGQKTSLSLAIFDVDHFKQVNDVYGHVVGDRVLIHLSQILKNNKSENIIAFRIGGEEFAVLFKDYCAKDAYKICDSMRSSMESSSLHEVDKKRITISGGLACMGSCTSAEKLFKAADSALYEAKNNGRNQVIIYEEPIRGTNQKKNDG